MAKYLLLKHYGVSPEGESGYAPLFGWTQAEIETHMAFQHRVIDELRVSGEFVAVAALASQSACVRSGGEENPPVVTDGPYAESKELVAGWFMVDVDSAERAYEIAARVSSAPGRGGEPLNELIEVRPLMGTGPAEADV